MILRGIFYVIIFIISLALFLPKGDILNLIQDRFLKQEGIVLESNTKEHLFFTSLVVFLLILICFLIFFGVIFFWFNFLINDYFLKII